jgi:pyruvyltransferase
MNWIKNLFKTCPVKAYWWREVPNFGDTLAPLLLEHFAGIEKVEWDTISHASVASIGSILEHIPPLWDGYVLGSGKLFEFSRLHLHTKTAKILAIRGPLSARGVPGDFALGDPGLLANELVGPQEKLWDLGIAPHWQDDELAKRFTRLILPPYTCKVINPGDDPLAVLCQIGASRRIVTSSLHGMVVADAFGGIPRRVEICPAMLKDGGDFKFRDYCASIQIPFETGVMAEPSRFRVEDVQFALYDAYQALGEALKP